MDLQHLEWPFLSPGHRSLAADYLAWTTPHLAGLAGDEGGDGRAARQIYEMLAGAGWLTRTLPASTDRASPKLDLRSLCILRELSAYSSAIADVALSEPWLGILPIALFGSPALRELYLPRYLSGNLLPAFALSEPGAGSDAASITTSARRDGNGYVLNGRKTWTSNCGLADLYVVFARLEETGGIAAFAVDGNDPAIRLEERIDVMPPHTVGTWTLDGCRVSRDRLIGEAGQGYKIAMAVLELFRPTVGAAALGFARRAMDEAVERSVGRTAFGKPISEHQLVQAKLAQMAVGVDASGLLVYRAAWEHDEGRRLTPRSAAVAKLFSTETSFQIVDQALQIFGGMGVVKGTTVERLFRHVRAFRIFDGTSEIQHLIIARDVLKGRA
ncbi:acyl-CoA dehydrogenase family protein [Phreatobacter stygius]|uniref:Acyl-CoA dehydrogenase family protein n=1 Tax=Phreatobacter stygius TaxID=1940610 RepID=A0A4D7B2I3_9HYPH|nr:acyl-CoA dehydrogenase family protein [Phreatobacter stygius]QCI67959.1 acyl-CoA dehydrogenase family protein [Phreatobacter stygius]